MKVIAVTGGIACGKTTLVSALKQRGAFVIDADAISRQLTMDGGLALPKIFEAFGESVFTFGGALNRKALGDLVFNHGEKRQTLNGIIHPLVEKEILRQLGLARDGHEAIAILDIPLLFEAHMEKLCDEIWCAWLPQETQIARLMERNHFSREEALARIRSQMPLEEKAARSDQVIDTSGSIAKSAEKIIKLYDDKMKEL